MKIEIECCGGNEKYKGQCLEIRCPAYRQAERNVDRRWPRLATGFGNAYGNPQRGHYLAEVKNAIVELEQIANLNRAQEEEVARVK